MLEEAEDLQDLEITELDDIDVMAASFPTRRREMVLLTTEALRTASRQFRNVSSGLTLVQVVARKRGLDDAANQIEEHIIGMMNKVSTELDAENERLKALGKSNGVSGSESSYSAPKKIAYSVANPMTDRYMGLIKKLDDLVGLTDTLWLAGVLESRYKILISRDSERKVHKVANKVRALANELRAQINQVEKAWNEKKAAKSANQNQSPAAEESASQEEPAAESIKAKVVKPKKTTKKTAAKKLPVQSEQEVAVAASA